VSGYVKFGELCWALGCAGMDGKVSSDVKQGEQTCAHRREVNGSLSLGVIVTSQLEIPANCRFQRANCNGTATAARDCPLKQGERLSCRGRERVLRGQSGSAGTFCRSKR